MSEETNDKIFGAVSIAVVVICSSILVIGAIPYVIDQFDRILLIAGVIGVGFIAYRIKQLFKSK